MSRPPNIGPRLDVEGLPPYVAAAVEAAVAGESITLVRSGHPIGALEFCSSVLEGTVIANPTPPGSKGSAPDGVSVVATAMRLSDVARRRLSDEFGDAYIVVDLHEAPASTDVLLTHPVSPQLLRILRQQFPDARVVITEIEDEELGSLPGPRQPHAGRGCGRLPPTPTPRRGRGPGARLPHAGKHADARIRGRRRSRRTDDNREVM